MKFNITKCKFQNGGLVRTKLTPDEEYTYQNWKQSMPPNLKKTDDINEYDMRGAWKLGYEPELAEDGSFHLPSRNYKNGEQLKSPYHPTFQMGLEYDIKEGFTPSINPRTGKWYTKKMQNGGKVHIANTPNEYTTGLKDNNKNNMFFPNTNNMTMKGMSTPIKYYGITNNQITDEGIAYPGEDFKVNGEHTFEQRINNNDMGKYNINKVKFQKGGGLKPIPNQYIQDIYGVPSVDETPTNWAIGADKGTGVYDPTVGAFQSHYNDWKATLPSPHDAHSIDLIGKNSGEDNIYGPTTDKAATKYGKDVINWAYMNGKLTPEQEAKYEKSQGFTKVDTGNNNTTVNPNGTISNNTNNSNPNSDDNYNFSSRGVTYTNGQWIPIGKNVNYRTSNPNSNQSTFNMQNGFSNPNGTPYQSNTNKNNIVQRLFNPNTNPALEDQRNRKQAIRQAEFNARKDSRLNRRYETNEDKLVRMQNRMSNKTERLRTRDNYAIQDSERDVNNQVFKNDMQHGRKMNRISERAMREDQNDQLRNQGALYNQLAKSRRTTLNQNANTYNNANQVNQGINWFKDKYGRISNNLDKKQFRDIPQIKYQEGGSINQNLVPNLNDNQNTIGMYQNGGRFNLGQIKEVLRGDRKKFQFSGRYGTYQNDLTTNGLGSYQQQNITIPDRPLNAQRDIINKYQGLGEENTNPIGTSGADAAFTLNYNDNNSLGYNSNIGKPSDILGTTNYNIDDNNNSINNETTPNSKRIGNGRFNLGTADALQIGAELMPAIYNFGLSTMKPRQEKPMNNKYRYEVLDSMARRKYNPNYEPIISNINATRSNIANNAPNAQVARANQIATLNQGNQMLRQEAINEMQANQQYKDQYNQMKYQIGSEENEEAKRINELNKQHEYTRDNLRHKSIGQFAEAMDTTGEVLQNEKQNQMNWALMSQVHDQYGLKGYQDVMKGLESGDWDAEDMIYFKSGKPLPQAAEEAKAAKQARIAKTNTTVDNSNKGTSIETTNTTVQ